MSRYPVVTADVAARHLHDRRSGEAGAVEGLISFAGSGADVDSKPVDRMVRDLRTLQSEFRATLKRKDQEGGRFEREACAVVHGALLTFERAPLADPDFWTYLAVARLADVIEWRFGTEGHPAAAANYGVGQRTENMLFRLWLRGELGRGEGTDPYELAKTGDQDLWRSHLLRQGYACVRPVARALLELQAGRLRGPTGKEKKLSIEDVRELAKRLKRLRANVMFEALDAARAAALVAELAGQVRRDRERS